MIRPLSAEQTEGPKKVRAVPSMLATVFVIVPHNSVLAIIKLQYKEDNVSYVLHPSQEGKLMLFPFVESLVESTVRVESAKGPPS